jgi:hypothetical protein
VTTSDCIVFVLACSATAVLVWCVGSFFGWLIGGVVLAAGELVKAFRGRGKGLKP